MDTAVTAVTGASVNDNAVTTAPAVSAVKAVTAVTRATAVTILPSVTAIHAVNGAITSTTPITTYPLPLLQQPLLLKLLLLLLFVPVRQLLQLFSSLVEVPVYCPNQFVSVRQSGESRDDWSVNQALKRLEMTGVYKSGN